MNQSKTFDLLSCKLVRLLDASPDWHRETNDARYQKTGRLKYSYRKMIGLFGHIYLSKYGTLHYEYKFYATQGRKPMLLGSVMQSRKLPTSLTKLERLLHELTQLAPYMLINSQTFKGWDGAKVESQKLYQGNVN